MATEKPESKAEIIHPGFKDVKVLFFDVFGTVVDWRNSVINELEAYAQMKLETRLEFGFLRRYSQDERDTSGQQRLRRMTHQDWATFAQQWRHSYYEYTRAVADDSSITVKTIDEHHRESFSKLLREWNLANVWNDFEENQLSQVWHRLDAWPDATEGLTTLNKAFDTATLSNGDVNLLTNMAKHAKLPWVHVFSADMFGTFKPNPKVYLGAAEKLGLKPAECCLVAAHLGDLEAAKSCGFKTIYVERLGEEAWDESKVNQVRAQGKIADEWIGMDEERRGFQDVALRLLGSD